jgi:probable HAF family extracellular repeat protein
VIASAAHAQFYAVTDLGALGGTNGMAYGINNHEQIVGSAQTGMGQYHAFMFDEGRMIDLGTLGGSNSAAWMINVRNEMVGWAVMTNGTHHAFFTTDFTAVGSISQMGDTVPPGSGARFYRASMWP